MVEASVLNLDPYTVSKITLASKKLGIEPADLINKILKDWIESNKWLTISVDDIINEFEKTLTGYSASTKKTKLKVVKSFLEWCEANKVEPAEEVIGKYLNIITSSYSSSYILHAKATLKDFVTWYKSVWSK
jgi:phage host-nuclease inhibitor protein Gam